MSFRQHAAGVVLATGLLAGATTGCSSSELPECEPTPTALMDNFTAHEIEESSPLLPDDSAAKEVDRFIFRETNLDKAPIELVDAYVAEHTDLAKGLSLSFDGGIVPARWTDPGDVQTIGQKQVLLGKVDSIMRVVGEYPEGLLKKLDVEHLRLGDIYKYNYGHFDYKTKELLIEYDTFSQVGEDMFILRKAFVHEFFGHAAHTKYCQGKILNDPGFSAPNGNFTYIGDHAIDSSPQESKQLYEEKVPPELVAYGPDRMFATPYGATTAAEDFATIAVFTLEERGIIQPEDADFGSPLQQKQDFFIDRLNELFPGFRTFAEQRTTILRRNPSNEIYPDRPRETVLPRNTLPGKDVYDPSEDDQFEYFETLDQLVVLDGAVYIPPDSKERVGSLALHPAVHPALDGTVTMFSTPGLTSTVDSETGITFFKGTQYPVDVSIAGEATFGYLSATVRLDSVEADEFFGDKIKEVVTTPRRDS